MQVVLYAYFQYHLLQYLCPCTDVVSLSMYRVISSILNFDMHYDDDTCV
jgi:hypothetical protein